MNIGLLSDTHTYLPPKTFDFFKDVDEIWHVGDIGNLDVVEKLEAFKPFRAVYGNIDGHEIRAQFPEDNIFMCEQVKVYMTHIGGYPGRYQPRARQIIERTRPKLFISGHSHILKVMYDKKHQLLHINPGAAGKYGLHSVITMVRFSIDGSDIKDMEILELPKAQKVSNI